MLKLVVYAWKFNILLAFESGICYNFSKLNVLSYRDEQNSSE